MAFVWTGKAGRGSFFGRDVNMQAQDILPQGRLSQVDNQRKQTSLQELCFWGNTELLTGSYVSCSVEVASTYIQTAKEGLLPFLPPYSGSEALHPISSLAAGSLDSLCLSCVGKGP